MAGKKRHFGGAFFLAISLEKTLFALFKEPVICVLNHTHFSHVIALSLDGFNPEVYQVKPSLPGNIQVFKFIQRLLDQTMKGIDNEQKASV